MTAKNVHREIILEELSRYDIDAIEHGNGRHPYIQATLRNGMRVKISYTSTGNERGRLDNIRLTVRRRMRHLQVPFKEGVQPPKPIIEVKPKRIIYPPNAPQPEMRAAPIPAPIEAPAPTARIVPQPQETTTMTKRDYKGRMTQEYTSRITLLIATNTRDVDGGKISYAEGWSDERVAEVANKLLNPKFPIDAARVRGVRKMGFVNWVVERPAGGAGNRGGYGPWSRRIIALEEEVGELRRVVNELLDAKTQPTNGTHHQSSWGQPQQQSY